VSALATGTEPAQKPFFPKNKRLSQAELAMATEFATTLYNEGMSIMDVSKQIGRAYSTVRKYLSDAGVELRSRGGRRNTRQPPAPSTSPLDRSPRSQPAPHRP
jgi:hypothetical protein